MRNRLVSAKLCEIVVSAYPKSLSVIFSLYTTVLQIHTLFAFLNRKFLRTNSSLLHGSCLRNTVVKVTQSSMRKLVCDTFWTILKSILFLLHAWAESSASIYFGSYTSLIFFTSRTTAWLQCLKLVERTFLTLYQNQCAFSMCFSAIWSHILHSSTSLRLWIPCLA